MAQIKLPNLGENIESGDVLTIFVSEGDTVKPDQDLLEVETDKATMPIPSPEGGKVVKILVAEGDTVAVGAPIMEIESANGDAKSAEKKEAPAKKEAKPSAKQKQGDDEEGDGDEAADDEAAADEQEEAPPSKSKRKPAKPRLHDAGDDEEGDGEHIDEEQAEIDQPVKKPAGTKSPRKAAPAAEEGEDSEVAEEARPTSAMRTTMAGASAGKGKGKAKAGEDTPGDGHAASAASPAVRRLARELGVELRRVRPSGEGGRITAEDVRGHVRETNEQVAASLPRGVTPPGTPDTDDYGAVRVEKMSRMRQTIARNMIESYTTIPQLTNFDDADVTELEDMREQSKPDYASRGIKLTALPFLIKAVASSLRRHPVLNASVDLEHKEITYKEYVNIGIAVDTERGLIVPVMRDVDRKSISQIATELDDLATSVREGEFNLEDLRGGTFTISNLGSVGGTYSTPIINPPQVAILLAGRSRVMPQIVEDAVEPRLMMPLSITYDHRLVDGAAAARFLNEVKSYLSAPGRLLLAP